MATSYILPFAGTDTGTNLLTQAEYEADAQRIIGHQPGVARSKLENKALRQASAMAAGLAQFIADKQSADVTDALTPADIATMLASASAATASGLFDFLVSRPSGYYKLAKKFYIQWGYTQMPQSNDAVSIKAVTFPIAFTYYLGASAALQDTANTNGALAMIACTNVTNSGMSLKIDTNSTATVNKNVPVSYIAWGVIGE